MQSASLPTAAVHALASISARTVPAATLYQLRSGRIFAEAFSFEIENQNASLQEVSVRRYATCSWKAAVSGFAC